MRNAASIACEYLIDNGPATIAEMVDALGISDTGLREAMKRHPKSFIQSERQHREPVRWSVCVEDDRATGDVIGDQIAAFLEENGPASVMEIELGTGIRRTPARDAMRLRPHRFAWERTFSGAIWRVLAGPGENDIQINGRGWGLHEESGDAVVSYDDLFEQLREAGARDRFCARVYRGEVGAK